MRNGERVNRLSKASRTSTAARSSMISIGPGISDLNSEPPSRGGSFDESFFARHGGGGGPGGVGGGGGAGAPGVLSGAHFGDGAPSAHWNSNAPPHPQEEEPPAGGGGLASPRQSTAYQEAGRRPSTADKRDRGAKSSACVLL